MGRLSTITRFTVVNHLEQSKTCRTFYIFFVSPEKQAQQIVMNNTENEQKGQGNQENQSNEVLLLLGEWWNRERSDSPLESHLSLLLHTRLETHHILLRSIGLADERWCPVRGNQPGSRVRSRGLAACHGPGLRLCARAFASIYGGGCSSRGARVKGPFGNTIHPMDLRIKHVAGAAWGMSCPSYTVLCSSIEQQGHTRSAKQLFISQFCS